MLGLGQNKNAGLHVKIIRNSQAVTVGIKPSAGAVLRAKPCAIICLESPQSQPRYNQDTDSGSFQQQLLDFQEGCIHISELHRKNHLVKLQSCIYILKIPKLLPQLVSVAIIAGFCGCHCSLESLILLQPLSRLKGNSP